MTQSDAGTGTSPDTDSSTVIERLRIGRVERRRVGEAASLLAHSFTEEPLYKYLLPGDARRREQALNPFFRVMVRSHLPFGEVHAALLGDRLVGVGVRLPPGAYPLKGRHQLSFMLGLIPTFLGMVMAFRSARHLLKVVEDLEHRHPHDRPHWYLMFVGIEPTLQGKGIGARLAQEVIDRADAAGVGCYLETFGEGTAGLYKHRGFVVREELRPFSDGPVGWTMWRDPQPAATGSQTRHPA